MLVTKQINDHRGSSSCLGKGTNMPFAWEYWDDVGNNLYKVVAPLSFVCWFINSINYTHRGVPKMGGTPKPWLSILKTSNDLDDLGVALF